MQRCYMGNMILYPTNVVFNSCSASIPPIQKTKRFEDDLLTFQSLGATLAAECGITAAQFTQYNPSSTECSTLAVGEYVCCSVGNLPNNAPSPNANGYCYSYLVQPGDYCAAIAASYDVTVSDIETYNAKTWVSKFHPAKNVYKKYTNPRISKGLEWMQRPIRWILHLSK